MEYRLKYPDRAAGEEIGRPASRLLAAMMVLAPTAFGVPAQESNRVSAEDPLEVTVRVVDASGEEEEWSPIPGALVWATCSVGSRTVEFEEYEIALGETTSDERGEARIRLDPLLGLPPIDRADCNIWVNAAHDGYAPANAPSPPAPRCCGFPSMRGPISSRAWAASRRMLGPTGPAILSLPELRLGSMTKGPRNAR